MIRRTSEPRAVQRMTRNVTRSDDEHIHTINVITHCYEIPRRCTTDNQINKKTYDPDERDDIRASMQIPDGVNRCSV